MILRLLFTIIILYLLYRIIKGLLSPFGRKTETLSNENQEIKTVEDLVEDPYCHSYIPLSDAYKALIDGQTIYFCSQKCFQQYKTSGEGK